ncbi:MAG: energy-coupling factor ABC transporter permease [Candidatus Bathyarchaeota archaeon]|nr:energy-coupling factor ABC transporter permease [Candidatus Bathyarchaeota archaeon]
MHISDGLINPQNPANLATAVIMWLVSIAFLAWSWKKAKSTYSSSITALLAISSAFVFAAQILNFPIAFGTSGHLVGGTFLAVLLGPYAAILSMTIVLLMQAFFFADGGIVAFGMNVFNMAIIGGLSFFLIKLFMRKSDSKSRFAASVFAASFLSVILGAFVTSLEIAPAFAGGVAVTVPSMLFYHALIGLGEGAITTALVTSLQRLQPTVMNGLALLKGRGKL